MLQKASSSAGGGGKKKKKQPQGTTTTTTTTESANDAVILIDTISFLSVSQLKGIINDDGIVDLIIDGAVEGSGGEDGNKLTSR